jgi:hypothetical protein
MVCHKCGTERPQGSTTKMGQLSSITRKLLLIVFLISLLVCLIYLMRVLAVTLVSAVLAVATKILVLILRLFITAGRV